MIDLDGTLVDTLGDFGAALNLMLADLPLTPQERQHAGLPLGPRVVESMVGQGSEHLIASALRHVLQAGQAQGGLMAPESTFDLARLEALSAPAWAAYQAHYLAVNGLYSAIYPGVLQSLKRWHAAGLPMACLTNKPVAFARQLLAQKGLQGYFSHVFGGDSFERKKPDPLPLLMTCQALASEPGATLMLGDSIYDAQAARAAGCPVVLVSYGYSHGQAIGELDADGYVDSLAELGFATL